MVILGIETSCDETSAAIIEANGDQVILKSNVIASSLSLHAKTGGVIPEIAAREQLKFMLPVLREAMESCRPHPNPLLKGEGTIWDALQTIDAIAVTYGPGLIGSLLVGVETARTLAYVLKKPLIPVNHMLGHIYANFISEAPKVQNPNSKLTPISYPLTPNIQFPLIAVVVSGLHTDLLLLKKHGDYTLLGGTRDDAAGEAFDKVGRLLGFPYPAGSVIERLAKEGNPKRFRFPRPLVGSGDFEFSFSGLKTAVLREVMQLGSMNQESPLRPDSAKATTGEQDFEGQAGIKGKDMPFSSTASRNLDEQTIKDIARGTQDAVIDVITKKAMKAVEKYSAKSVLLGGGVAANQTLQDRFKVLCSQFSVNFFAPQRNLCTDNAAMIACAAYFNNQSIPWQKLSTDPELYFDEREE